MTGPSPAMRALARQLLKKTPSGAGASGAGAVPRAHEAAEVCERLRAALSRFAGSDGFEALLRRALALARVEMPELRNVRLGAGGRIEGLEETVVPGKEDEAAIAVAAQVLELLVTFIGKPLTLRLVRDGWPALEAGPKDTTED